MRKRDLRVPAAYVVHFLAHELNASRKFGHNGNKGRFQLFRRNLRHAEQTGKKHVAGKSGMGADGQHGRGWRVVFVMVMVVGVGMIVMFVAHR